MMKQLLTGKKQLLSRGGLRIFESFDYDRIVRSVAYADLVDWWKMNDTDTTLRGAKAGLNGTYFNTTNGAAVVDSDRIALTAAQFDGMNGYATLPTLTGFNGQEGSILLWIRMTNGSVWDDLTSDFLINFYYDAFNYIRIVKPGAYRSTLAFQYVAGNVAHTISVFGVPSTEWMCVAMEWSLSQDRLRLHINGYPIQSDLDGKLYYHSGLGTWTGSPGTRRVGTLSADGGEYNFNGSMAHLQLYRRALTDAEIAQLSLVNYFSRSGATTSILYVAKTGNDTTGDGTVGNPYLTIGKANAVANDGSHAGIDRIQIGAGTYSETVTPPRTGLTYYGADQTTIISGGAGNGLTIGTNINAIKIRNLKIDGAAIGVSSSGAYGTVVSNCEIANTSSGGLLISGGYQSRAEPAVHNCTVHHTAGNGAVMFQNTYYGHVKDSLIYSVGTRGIYLSTAQYCRINNVIIHDVTGAGYGLESENSAISSVVSNCTFYNVVYGAIQKTSTGGEFNDCIAHDCSSAGFFWKDGDLSSASRCAVADSAYGFYIADNAGNPSANVALDHHTITDCETGIAVFNGSDSGFTSDFNAFTGNTSVGNWLGTLCATLAAWRTASGQDANST